jgi:hypothetical protein
MSLLYAILGGFARRWYGGALEDYKILKNRGVQTVFMCLLFLSIYLPVFDNWLMPIVITAWLQFQFWSRFHGGVFDIGRGNKSQETIDRCNKYWWHYPVDCIFKLLKAEDKKYGFLYDILYMGFRYTCPMIPMMLFDWRYILVGLAISPIYAFCWTLYERENWLFKNKPDWINYPTKLAEIICGALVFSSCYLLEM